METQERPVINVAGTDFHVTAFSMELVQVANEANRISVQEMLAFDDHLEFLFDKSSRQLYEGRWDTVAEDANVERIWIRPLEALDPVGAEQVFKLSHLPATPDYYHLLPTVKIADQTFMIDESVKGFRQQNNPWNIIRFSDVINEEKPFVYYDTRVHNTPFPHDFDSYSPPKNLPEHIVKAQLPSGRDIAVLIQQSQAAIRSQEQRNNHNRSKRKGRGL